MYWMCHIAYFISSFKPSSFNDGFNAAAVAEVLSVI